jgi:HPr kinase/phosphorylase
MRKPVQVAVFLETPSRVDSRIKIIAGESGHSKEIKISEINRPGLALVGFYDFFAYDRIQIFGLGEATYIKRLSDEQRKAVYSEFFSYDILCCIFTHNETPDELFCQMADSKGIPVFITERKTTNFVNALTHLLYDLLAPNKTVHATFVDVYGIGVLLVGESGIGKSECALELLERGHKLVADDMVEIKRVDDAILMGSCTETLKHFMEIRGLGIINVRDIFGIRSMCESKRIDLVVLLKNWDNQEEYDRLGLDENVYTILDVNLPIITIPVKPGRNIPIIIEVAALNQHLKNLGINSAQQLDELLKKFMENKRDA